MPVGGIRCNPAPSGLMFNNPCLNILVHTGTLLSSFRYRKLSPVQTISRRPVCTTQTLWLGFLFSQIGLALALFTVVNFTLCAHLYVPSDQRALLGYSRDIEQRVQCVFFTLYLKLPPVLIQHRMQTSVLPSAFSAEVLSRLSFALKTFHS